MIHIIDTLLPLGKFFAVKAEHVGVGEVGLNEVLNASAIELAKKVSKEYVDEQISSIPKVTKTSQLQNDSGFITQHQSLAEYVKTTDSRLTDARPASDVKAWAKADSKPTYTASEVGALPSSTAIPSKTSQLKNDSGFLTSHQDISGKADASTVESISARVGTVAEEQSVLTARMDTFASLTEGSTTGDAELADIRVGANGKTYADAGSAVRGQIVDIKSDVKDIRLESGEFTTYTADVKTGYYEHDGTFKPNSGWQSAKIYPVNVKTFRVKGRMKGSLNWAAVYFNDASGNVIGHTEEYSDVTNYDLTFRVPNGTAFFTINSSNAGDVDFAIYAFNSYIDEVKHETGLRALAKSYNLLECQSVSYDNYSGVRITVNTDKSITLNGTATADINFRVNPSFKLEYGCCYNVKIDNMDENINFQLNKKKLDGTYEFGIASYINPKFWIASDYAELSYTLKIKSGTVCNNVTVYPQICANVYDFPYKEYTGVYYPESTKGKKIICFGDSITYGDTLTDVIQGYSYLATSELGMHLTNLGKNATGFTTLWSNSQTGNFYDILTNTVTSGNYDMVMIAYGTNDYGLIHSSDHTDDEMPPFGSVTDDATAYTFCGIVRKTFEKVNQYFKTKNVIVMLPLPRLNGEVPNKKGKTLNDYSDAIRTIAHEFKWPCLDMTNESNIKPNNDGFKASYMPDGLHPNYRGHYKFVKNKVQQFILDNVPGEDPENFVMH